MSIKLHFSVGLLWNSYQPVFGVYATGW